MPRHQETAAETQEATEERPDRRAVGCPWPPWRQTLALVGVCVNRIGTVCSTIWRTCVSTAFSLSSVRPGADSYIFHKSSNVIGRWVIFDVPVNPTGGVSSRWVTIGPNNAVRSTTIRRAKRSSVRLADSDKSLPAQSQL